MSTIIQGYHLRTSIIGQQVVKAAQALPQNAMATLFTVNHGSVLVMALLGLVTTAIGATATSLSVGIAPVTGAANPAGISAATAIASAQAGSLIIPVQSAGIPAQLAIGASAGNAMFMSTPLIVSPGTITWTTNAANTGQVKWYIHYVEIDPAATVS